VLRYVGLASHLEGITIVQVASFHSYQSKGFTGTFLKYLTGQLGML